MAAWYAVGFASDVGGWVIGFGGHAGAGRSSLELLPEPTANARVGRKDEPPLFTSSAAAGRDSSRGHRLECRRRQRAIGRFPGMLLVAPTGRGPLGGQLWLRFRGLRPIGAVIGARLASVPI